ncbi:MAG: hypothetical protein ACK4RK_02510 [Gemmataceae bacterium]
MGIMCNLSALALQPLIDSIGGRLGIAVAEQTSETIVGVLHRHFVDHSQKLTLALHQANDHAWRAFEIALAGDTWRERWQRLLARKEE